MKEIMIYEVILTQDAENDLITIYDYKASSQSINKAKALLNDLEATLLNLSTFPERGSYPKELLQWGIKEYRQVFCKTYRLIYRVVEHTVYVQLIVDGKRNMESLLSKRLINPFSYLDE